MTRRKTSQLQAVQPMDRAVDAMDETPSPVPPLARAVRRLNPYDPTTSLYAIKAAPPDGPVPYKLDWNESTLPPAPGVITAITRFLGNSHHLNWYPELECPRLLHALAAYTGVSEDSLLVTNGSDDALALVCNSFLDPSDEVVVPEPTYTHFLVFAQAKSGQIRSVRFEDPFVVDVKRILAAVTPRTKVIYLVSPNNPTGTVFDADQVTQVLAAAPHAVVIVDEAYFEFHGASVMALTARFPNLVVTRTFSKSFGMAGLRVGYLAAHPRLLHELKRIFNPKSVNVLGQIAATAALADRAYLEAYVAEVTASKAILADFFARQGVRCRVTPANYVLVQVDDARAFCRRLEAERIYVRDRSTMAQLEGMVRITVGTTAQTRDMLPRIARALSPESAPSIPTVR